MERSGRFGILAALFGIACVFGCQGGERKVQASFTPEKKGAYLRLVNLTDSSVKVTSGFRQLFSTDPGIATAFSLQKPGKLPVKVDIGSSATYELELTLEPQKTLTVYVLGKGADDLHKVEGDERRASPDEATARLVNLTNAPITATVDGQSLSAQPRSASQTLKVAPGSLTLDLGSGEPRIPFQGEAEVAYTLVVYPRGGASETKIIESSGKMQTAEGGASASG